jgi:ABC-type transport system involved in multi-copper enzyme maturation permease subunit
VFFFGLLVTWITPVWLLSAGVALGVAVLAVAFGVLWLVSRRRAADVVANVRSGVLLPIFYLAMFLTAFALVGVFLVPDMPARSLLGSVTRINSVGRAETVIEVPKSVKDFEVTELGPRQSALRQSEFQGMVIEADAPLSVQTNISSNIGQFLSVNLVPGSPFSWRKPFVAESSRAPVVVEPTIRWFVTNVNAEPVKLRVLTQSDIEFPEVRVIPATAVALVALVAIYLALGLVAPKVAAIAQTTAKEAMSQPLFYLALGLGAFLLIAFVVIPYNTFGEDVKMLKDSGLTLIMVLAIITAVWSASVSVSEEVEGRTALTVLSKPVRRRQFILGKFLGVLGPVVVLFVVLGFLFLVTISFKVVYDSREVAKSEPTWQLCYLEMITTVPGLVLAFLETVVLAAISVAISTRLPMLANLIVCASIYVLGHLVPMLVNSSVGKFEIVRFVGHFIATVLPVLDHFNIQAAVAAGAAVPTSYLWMALVYCVLYSSIAMLLGLAMFEDRDLA